MLHSSFVTLYNYYGPTEASVYASGKHVLRDQLPGRLASIGKPLPNVTCYVVDPASTTNSATSVPLLQPVGVWGELWLGGVQVARGYLNRPELTAERFVPNPWPETDPSGRGVAYRTGDRVRWCAPGDIGRVGARINIIVPVDAWALGWPGIAGLCMWCRMGL